MNRLTTVLYPSNPAGSSSDSSLASTTHEGRQPSPALGPSAAIEPQFPLPMNSTSIYNDPRSTVFGSPEREVPLSATYASVATSAAAIASAASIALTASTASASTSTSGAASIASSVVTTPPHPHSATIPSRPSLLKKLTDEGIKASAARRSASPSPSRRKTDRGLRINLMQAAQAKSNKGRGGGIPAPAGGGRLSSMARGPVPGRYVVGGGQYLRVLEINTYDDGRRTPDGARTPTTTSPSQLGHRMAGPPFARGSGGTTISEVVNFWKGSWAIGKGVNDVDWGMANFENKIVTATPGGNFMIFDIARGKLERETSGGHTRPMNCIRFSKVQNSPYLLITGGTEGQVRLWDMRDSEPTSRKFYKHNAPVTALSFSPDEQYSFVVGTEAGGLFRYDYRVQSKSVGKIWGAHGSKPVMDLKWKAPTDEYASPSTGKGWLASAGGDRTVQIWDMSQTWDKNGSPTHTLHTSHPARCVDWRPNHPTELVVVPFDILSGASDPARPEVTPDVSDCSLEVWDVRRHHVAKYAIPGLEGSAVSTIWDDADTLVACYENGGLVQRDLNSKVTPKTYPLESIPRQVAAWSAKGDLAYALDRFRPGEIPFDDVKPEFASGPFIANRNRKGIADMAYEPQQTLGVVPLPDHDEMEFVYIATHYKLEGEPPMKLCRWNREVAEVCGRGDEARIWDHLQGLLEEFGAAPEGFFNEAVFSQTVTLPRLENGIPSPRGIDHGADDHATPSSPYHFMMGIPLDPAESLVGDDADEEGDSDGRSASSESDNESSPEPVTPPRRPRFRSFVPPAHVHPSVLRSAMASSSRPDASLTPGGGHGYVRTPLMPRAKRLQVIETPMSEDTPNADEDWPDPYGIAAALEAVAPSGSRGGLTSRSTPHSTRPPTPALLDRKALTSVNASPLGSQRPSIVGGLKDPRMQPAAITRRAQETFPTDEWDRYRTSRCRSFLDWWKSYIDDGEVQLATALYVVGGKTVKFPKNTAEHVVQAYIDLLERHRLDIPVAYLRRNADILALQTLPGQDGITHILHCSNCGKSTGSLDDDPEKKKFWWCTKCRRAAKICTVCRMPVQGLWMGCNKCRHGGHQRCMRLYYLETEQTVAQPSAAPSRANSPPPTVRRHSAGPLPTVASAGSGGGQHSATSGGTGSYSVGTGTGAGSGAQAPSHGDASLDSGFTDRTEQRDLDGNGVHEVLVSTNTCPSGCGCRCRAFGAE